MDVENSNQDIKNQEDAFRSTTLKGQEYAEMIEKSPTLVQDLVPNMNSFQRIPFVSKPNMTHQDSLLSTQRQTKSSFQLKSSKKLNKTSRSYTNTAIPQ